MTRRFAIGAGWAMILIVLMLAGRGWADARPLPPLLPGFYVPTAVIAAVAALAGGFVTWAMSSYGTSGDQRRRIGYAALLPVVVLAGALLLAASVPPLSPPRAAAALLLGALAMVSGCRCVELLAAGESIGFESHWGGLGGGAGGWRLLPAGALAILALSFTGGALAVLAAEPSGGPQHAAAAPVPGGAGSDKISANAADAPRAGSAAGAGGDGTPPGKD